MAPQGQFADPRRLPRNLPSLKERIIAVVDRFQCQVLFVHRDAEGASWEDRREEIRHAFAGAMATGLNLPAVAVIPVRMSEAWLCFDVNAVRRASGNPMGTIRLALPALNAAESEPDPKGRLHDALRVASELTARRRKAFNPHQAAHLIAEYITDFSPLRSLPAFCQFEDAVRAGVKEGWREGLYD